MKCFISYLFVIAGLLVASTGCKKQAAPTEEIIITDTTTVEQPGADPVLQSTGIVAGKIMPETKYSLLLYNDQDVYEEYSILNRTGVFIMKNIKAGEYNLIVQPYDPDISSFELTKITVDSGRTTNLGIIFLP